MISNQERVGKALDLLRQGLTPFVERELKAQDAQGWLLIVRQSVSDTQVRMFADEKAPQWDAASLLAVLWNQWNTIFGKTLGQAERTLVSELRDVRNRWAHQAPFSGDDADRALDSMARLLTAVSAPQAEEINRSKQELRRQVFEEQVRHEKRKAGGSLIESASASTLRPWREVVTPHADVASGRYQQAEFAADLWQVHLGQGTDEYKKPAEFFRRTFLTESLERLLVGAVERLSGKGGDPVVQLQTNFGGGKTHSMLALYHLFSGVSPADLAGIDGVMAKAAVKTLPKAKRAVLVGNKISPGQPSTKPDGTVVRTLWGELAHQLGGKKAYARVEEDDARATNPGDVLRELFIEHGPCLVLIDEWVAYARQLHDRSDLPAGTFETQFTFAQALTEAARMAKNCLLVVSLPASDMAGSSPHTQPDDVEVGGIRGREALDRLRNVVGRMESSWRPATAEEGFEIVRRRLFEAIPAGSHKQRDVTARAFADLYGANAAEFPPECRDGDYERRMQAAYPIHPEIFDRLYTDWSTLVKFQRTRGVLRLMAAVIHSLWENGDKNPLILPSTIPIDDPRVQSELTRYLSDNWAPIIEKDVDGPASLPLKIDRETPNLGKLHATRRVARTIYLGSAPTSGAAHRGIEDRRVKLGCVMPGEVPQVFGDALRRLAGAATYLYQDGPRSWYSTQPTVTKLAEDRAEQLKRDPDKVVHELEERLRADLAKKGDFVRIHAVPRTSADVQDDLDARLVVLPWEHAYEKGSGGAAETAARAILETRGSAPRLYRNALVFLAADKLRCGELDEALRRYLAWDGILREKETLNLDAHQTRQAETQRRSADSTVTGRIPEAYQWLLVPTQAKASDPVTFSAVRLVGGDALAPRASKRLRSDEGLVLNLGPTILRKHMDDFSLWRGKNHAPVAQLAEDFARYPYLPRVQSPEVVHRAIREGLDLLTWASETFGYADRFDEATGRYSGLRGGQRVEVGDGHSGLLVRADVAAKIIADARAAQGATSPGNGPIGREGHGDGRGEEKPPKPPGPVAPVPPKRFHGTVALDPHRVGRDAGKIAEEVVAHLVGIVGARVHVTLDIEAEIPSGVPEGAARAVTENCRTLKFSSHGFERE